MTDKQKLKSLENKMKRLQLRNIEIDLKVTSRYLGDIERYSKLKNEHFHLQFDMEHCQTCGKKLTTNKN